MDNVSRPTVTPAPGAASMPSGAGRSGATAQTTAASPDKPTAAAPAFKIRYGRLALALTGLAALLTAVVGTGVSVAGFVPVFVPIVSFLIALASVVALRAMALRDRSKRAPAQVRPDSRDTGATTADTAGSNGTGEPAGPKRADNVFDAEKGTGDKAGEQPAQPRLTAADLRDAALAVAAEEDGKPAATQSSSWAPVEVPKPTYVNSAKAERPAPQPLDLPAQPKPEGKPSIKAAAVAPKVEIPTPATGTATEPTDTGTAATAVAGAADGADKQDASKPATGLHNLDDVLQRRRA